MINQIESYLALRRLTKEISYQEMFLQNKLSVNLVKTLEKNLQQHGEVVFLTLLSAVKNWPR